MTGIKQQVHTKMSKEDTKTMTATPVAAKLAEENGIDISNIQGTGQDGRILKVDVEAAISSPSVPADSGDEVQASATPPAEESLQQEVTPESGETTEEVEEAAEEESKVEVKEEAPLEMVGDRVVMAMIERRTGMPIRENVELLGSEPYYLTDSVMPVVALRVEKHEGNNFRETFNPVIPEGVFQDFFGEADTPEEPERKFFHKIGVYSFDGEAREQLRFSRGMDEEFGKNELERAARNWTLSVLANPHVTEGVYSLNRDAPGADGVKTKKAKDLQRISYRALQKTSLLNQAMGVPRTNELAMTRYSDEDTWPGEAFASLASQHLTRRRSLDKGFEAPKVYGLFTELDHRMVEGKGERSKAAFEEMMSAGAIQGTAIAVPNFREFVLGKFASGIQRYNPKAIHGIREFLFEADKLHQRGHDRQEISARGGQAVKLLFQIASDHIRNDLDTSFIESACNKVGRETGMNLDQAAMSSLAVHMTEKGLVNNDQVFQMSHAQDIMAGKHPMQKKLKKSVLRISRLATRWHNEAVRDCASALSGLKAYFDSRTSDGKRVKAYLCDLPVGELAKTVRRMEVRPSFYVLRGAPIQVVDKKLGGRVPIKLDGYFKS